MAIETLEDLFTTYNADITATKDEIDAWNILDPVQIESTKLMSGRLSEAEDNAVATKVGLFGADLTKFNEDCVALDTLCKVADYEDYNGWGVGVWWGSADVVTADQVDGVAFATSKWTVQVAWDAATNVISSAISDVAIAEDAPDGDLDLDDE